MAKETRYKCEDCKRILARKTPHRCNGVLQNTDKWEKVIIGLPSLVSLGAAKRLYARNFARSKTRA